jgi:hypothetical protein
MMMHMMMNNFETRQTKAPQNNLIYITAAMDEEIE